MTVRHLLEIRAPRERVFGALTTAGGLWAWWTTGVRAGEAAVGTYVDFTFRGAFNPRMEITELDPPARVVWTGAGGHDAWGATEIRFELTPTGDGTTVRFRHRMGADRGEDGVARAAFIWGYYLNSLRRYCEIGTGRPFRAGDPGARVGAD
jgi:uncharacterized protein YndB with AHSA1/START domain